MSRGNTSVVTLILLAVVIAAGGLWYWKMATPVLMEETEFPTTRNTNIETKAVVKQPAPTPTPQQKPIKITSPASGTKIDSYADFTVRWEVNSALSNETVGVYVSGAGHNFTCRPEQDGNRTSDYECTEALVAEIPASTGAHILKINPGCSFEMPVYVRIAAKNGTASDSVGPVILQGGACGPAGE